MHRWRGAPRADYVVAAWPCRTLFDEQHGAEGDLHGERGRRARAAAVEPAARGSGDPRGGRRHGAADDPLRARRRPARGATHRRLRGAAAGGAVGAASGARAVVAARGRPRARGHRRRDRARAGGQGFAVRGHARTARRIDGVRCHAGDAMVLDAFLDGLDVLVSVAARTRRRRRASSNRTTLSAARRRRAPGERRPRQRARRGRPPAAARRGRLSGATLDVFRQEPLPPDHPFWRRPRDRVTPHVAGLTDAGRRPSRRSPPRSARLERGEPVTGVVDRTRGY